MTQALAHPALLAVSADRIGLATVLALCAAVLHAGWNFLVKQSGDRFIALWAQFSVAGVLAAVGLATFGDLPSSGWKWAAVSGVIHVPYSVLLAKAYDLGDFSLVYPLARGGGAAGAAVLGVVLLDDVVTWQSWLGIGVIVAGLLLLSGRAPMRQVLVSLCVAATIAAYSAVDAHGRRVSGTAWYAAATHVGTMAGLTGYGAIRGRVPDLVGHLRSRWRWALPMGAASLATYGAVVTAFSYAPVGYVSALRESSVLIVAVLGWLKLRESAGHKRALAAVVILIGIAVLITSRT